VKELYQKGKINNNDLKMAGIIVQNLVLKSMVPMRHWHSAIFTDNSGVVEKLVNQVGSQVQLTTRLLSHLGPHNLSMMNQSGFPHC
jgi:hypothetical protein